MNTLVLDTETTGITDEDQILEAAWTETMPAPRALDDFSQVQVTSKRYGVTRPIGLGAMATHHIIEADVDGLAPFPGFHPVDDIEYICGHNIDFDWRMMGSPKVRRICTLALARSLWPDIDSHSLGAMVYHLSRDKARAREMVKGAHSAEADVRMILDVLLPEIQIKLLPHAETWAQLWDISEAARIPKSLTFGKHKGMLIRDVPADYKRWLLNQPDVDPYLSIALRARS
jgi:exodeoxyribonuclease X